jgi:hypothetical protein
MKILKNLTNYKDSKLETITVDSKKYLTNVCLEPSAILIQSFGKDTNKDSYNYDLASQVKDARIYFKKNLTAIIQPEIEGIFKEQKIGNYLVIGAEHKKKYLDTHYVLFLQRTGLLSKKIDRKNSLFICHPAHAQRVLKTAKKLELEGDVFLNKNFFWPNKDSQWHVRSKTNWALREIFTRIYFNKKNYV